MQLTGWDNGNEMRNATCVDSKTSKEWPYCLFPILCSGDPPPPLRNVTHFFDSAEASEALFIVQVLRLSAVYKSIKVHLRQGQD